jgi:predicted exporter/predicted LPLAT superfamily acyltransferase
MHRAGLVAMPLVLALGCAVLWVARPPALRTSLYDMAGSGGIPQALRGRSEGVVPIIVSSEDPPKARAAADALAALLEEVDGASVGGRTEGSGVAAMLETVLERRAGLVSPEDAQLLATPEGRARIARAAMRRYASSPLPPMFPPAEDPFCLADRFVSSLPMPSTGWERQDGRLEAGRNGVTHVLLPVELAPRVAGGGRALETFAREVSEAAEKVRAGHPGTEIAACGAPMHTAVASARCRREIGWLTVFSLAFIAGLSVLAFRGAGWIPLLAASLAVAAACGGLALLALFWEIHVMALVFGTTVLGLVVDYSFHWLMAGEANRRSVVRSLAASFATTEIGLLPLAFSSLPVLKQAAAFLAAGLLGALGYVLLCYPQGRAADGEVGDSGRTTRRRRWARWAAGAVLVITLPGLFRAKGYAGLDTLYRAPDDLAAAEKLFAELSAGDGAQAGGGFLVTESPGGNLEDLLAREAAAGLPENVSCLSRFLPPLERRREMAGLVAKLYEELGTKQAEWLGLDALELPPGPRAWEWGDIPPYAKEAFVAEGALVAASAPEPDGALPEGVVFCRPSETLAAMLADWTAEARQRLGLALAAMAAALLLLRGRNAIGDALPPLLALAAVGGGLGLAGEGVGLFHLLAGFLLAGMGVDYAIFLRGQGGAFRPALCSMLTSVAGFGALVFVSMPAARAFGIVLGGGLPVAFLCALAAPSARGAEPGGTEKCAWRPGLEILYWIYRLFGPGALRLAASCIGLVSWTFSPGARRATPSVRRLLAFCRSLADKMAVMSGERGKPLVASDGSEDMRAFLSDVRGGRGVFVVSSHCGTIEVLSAMGDGPSVFHAWMDFSRTSVFTSFYLRHARNRRVVLHPIGEFGPQTVFEAGDMLDGGNCLVMAGDSGGGRKMAVPFGDGEIVLREGAFRMARALGHPAYFVACTERAPGRYVASARRLEGGHADMAREYAEALHELVQKHPEQWFRWEADA